MSTSLRVRDEENYYIPIDDDRFTKSNYLIEAKYKSTLLENQLLDICLAKVQDDRYRLDSNGLFEVRIDVSEITDILGLAKNSKSIYTRINDVSKMMLGRQIFIENPKDKEFVHMNLIVDSVYRKGTLTIRFNDKIKPLLKGLHSKFTPLNIRTVASFNSVYSYRMYQILKSKAYTPGDGSRKVNNRPYKIVLGLNELKFSVGVINSALDSVKKHLIGPEGPDYDKASEYASEQLFKEWKDFKRRVLDTAVKEINESPYAGMRIEYDTRRSGIGGKVVAVIFYVNYTPIKAEDKIIDVEEKKELSDEEKLDFIDEIREVIDIPLKTKDLMSIAEVAKYNIDKIKKANNILNASGTTIKNVTAFMIAAIKNEYEEAVQKEASIQKNTKKGSFSNFNQRDYDMDALERLLLCNSAEELSDEEREELRRRAINN